MEKISVIVPVYNVEKYINKCIDSIINQTYKNLEIILVDDGSTDNSSNICEEYAQKDDRIKVIHKENGGQSQARNMGIENATGDYIGFIDSDDFIDDDMYERLLKDIKENNADLAMCRLIDCYGKIPKKDEDESVRVLNKEEAIKIVLEANITSVTVVNKLYKKEIFDNLKFQDIFTAEDAYIMIDILRLCNVIVLDMSQKYYYMHRDNSTTTKKFDKDIGYNPIFAYEKNYNIVVKDFPNLENVAKMRIIWANFIVLDRMINSGSEVDKKIVSYLRKRIIEILKSKYFTKYRKISAIALLININLYKACLKVFNKRKNKLYE